MALEITNVAFTSARRMRTGLDMVFSELSNFQHVNELGPITRELFRDPKGTLNGFMQGVS